MIRKTDGPLLTVAEVAEALGLSPDSVRRYCNSTPQRIRGKKFTRDWMVPKKEVERFRRLRKSPGRPRKRNQ